MVDKCIVLEDDDVPSVSFFTFCKEMLDKYEQDPRITMIAVFFPLTMVSGMSGVLFRQLGWMMCVGLMGIICQLAWSQGDDFFAYDDNLFMRACEYAACCNYTNETVPYTTYIWQKRILLGN